MQIYILVDQPDLGEKEAEAVAAVQAWVNDNSAHATLVYSPASDEAELELGISMKIKAPKQLIAPLNGLYTIAKQYKCEFVLGVLTEQEREDICYFGHEEGKADAYEVGSYLGFE